MVRVFAAAACSFSVTAIPSSRATTGGRGFSDELMNLARKAAIKLRGGLRTLQRHDSGRAED
jgi:hypothetical protein